MRNFNSHSQRSQKVAELGIFSIIALTLVAWASTTSASRVILSSFREVILLPLVVACVAYHVRAFITPLVLRGLIFWSFISLYALLLSMIHGSYSSELVKNTLFFWLIPFAFHFFFSCVKSELVSNLVMANTVWLTLSVFLLTFILGGLDLGPPPRFLFEAETFGTIYNLSYSLGSSRFYGFGSVITILLARECASNKKALIYYFLAFCFLLLCVVAGGRGEILIAVSLILISLGLRKIFLWFWLVVTLFLFSQSIGQLFFSLDIQVVERFLFFSHSLGLRDELLVDSFYLLVNEPSCIIIGCGFSFFETYYNYPEGFYPHNVLAESIIVFGLPVVFVIGVLAFKGSLKIFSRKRNPGFKYLFAFFFLVGLKSNPLLDSWIFAGCVLHMCAIGMLTSFDRNSRLLYLSK